MAVDDIAAQGYTAGNLASDLGFSQQAQLTRFQHIFLTWLNASKLQQLTKQTNRCLLAQLLLKEPGMH